MNLRGHHHDDSLCPFVGRCIFFLAVVLPVIAGESGTPCRADAVVSSRHPFHADAGWGYIDDNGNVAILPRFAQASEFQEGIASVRTPAGILAIIDVMGNIRAELPSHILRVGGFSDGLAWFTTRPFAFHYGAIDQKGAIVVPAKYHFVTPFSEGLAAVGIGTGAPEDAPDLFARVSWGYIDKRGRGVIPHKYADATRFERGFAMARLAGKNHSVIIGPSGRRLASLERLALHRGDICTATKFSEGFSAVTRYSFVTRRIYWVGLVSNSGKLVWTADEFDMLRRVSDGVIWARKKDGGKWVLLSLDGKALSNNAYDEVTDFVEGRALVRSFRSWLLIDKNCRAIERGTNRRTWNDGEGFVSELARVHIGGTLVRDADTRAVWWRGGAWYYVNREGRIVGICRKSGNDFTSPAFGKESSGATGCD